MQTVIIVIHLMIVSAMIGLVLLQKSEGGGLGMGGGAGFMSSRGTANLLSRTTAVLAGIFFLTSMALAWLAGVDRKPASMPAACGIRKQTHVGRDSVNKIRPGQIDKMQRLRGRLRRDGHHIRRRLLLRLRHWDSAGYGRRSGRQRHRLPARSPNGARCRRAMTCR